MDIKVQMARSEAKRQSVLLAGSGARVDRQTSSGRDSGQEDGSDAEGNEGLKVISAAEASKSNAKAKSRDGRRCKRRQTYTFGESIREAQRRNPAPGRTAQELGIVWLESRCEDSPITKAHHFVGKNLVDNGTVYTCIFCHKVKWLPNEFESALVMGNLMAVYGLDGGYQRTLDKHPAARRLISKIQDIYYLKQIMPKEQFPIAVAAIILDRQYPYDLEITEEELL